MILFGIVFMPRDCIDGASHRVVREKEHGTELLNELGLSLDKMLCGYENQQLARFPQTSVLL
jgi:hypothetical protein